MSARDSSPSRLATARARWQELVDEVQRHGKLDFAQQYNLFTDLTRTLEIADGPLPAWWPGDNETTASNLAWLRDRLGLTSYGALHRWSTSHREEFWHTTIDRLEIRFATRPTRTLHPDSGAEQPRWLPGSRYNIVDSCFQGPREAPAIVWATEDDPSVRTVSYGELERLVGRITTGLKRHGFKAGDAIALYLPMTVECVAAYLAIVRLGATVVSVADSFSAAELARRVRIAGAVAILSIDRYQRAGHTIELYSKVRRALRSSGEERRCILINDPDQSPPVDFQSQDVLWEDLLTSDGGLESSIAAADGIINILFSSGTTGDPKAIPWTHLTPLKSAMDGHFHQDIRPSDVVAWPTNIGWMMGPWLIFATLLNRATIALHHGAPHTKAFTDFVTNARITVLGLVPALVRAWRAAELIDLDSWQTIKLFSSTGEPSNVEDYLWLMSRAGYRAPVIEYLGGTEIGGGHLTGSVLQPASPATFSTPALGLDFTILDDLGQPVGEGQIGELFLRPPSIGLSQRLLNRDHHEVYYAGCPSARDGSVLRRHGDQIARLGQGYFKAQGRADDTMNLGGIKVSSLELEEVINGHPSIYESAAVAVQPSGEGADHLVVYVVLEPKCDPTEIRQELQGRLASELNPLFKIHDLVVLDALPRTASNKVMRRKLRAAWFDRQAAR